MVMTMVTKSLSASVFKAKCLALMDEVARTGEAIVITKNGVPVAQLVPLPDRAPRKSAFGMHRGLIRALDDVDPDLPVVDPREWTFDATNVIGAKGDAGEDE